MKKFTKVSILVDNKNSWFNIFLKELIKVVKKYSDSVGILRSASSLKRGDILFALSCGRILKKEQLSLHKSNIVIHASDLPKGRGWSPWTWQVELGKKIIPLTLFEANEECDAGDYYFKSFIDLDGTELIDEIRQKLARKIITMVEQYLKVFPMRAKPQKGKSTYFRKRNIFDSELNINKTLKSQFNKMRITDNQRYPLWFQLRGKKYTLKVYRDAEND